MSLPLLTALAPRWETELAAAVAGSARVHVARRCADVPELLGVAAAGLGGVALVSSDFRGLDRSVVDALARHRVAVVGVHPPGDEVAARTLLRWGLTVVVPADVDASALETALAQATDPPPGTAPTAGLDPGGPAGTTAPEDDGEPREGLREGRVLVVWGAHGSAGRTTVAVNLAAELATPVEPVLLVDADTYGASVAQSLAVLDEAPGLAAAARAADQGILDRGVLLRLAPEVRPGLRVLTGLPRADRWPEIRDVALADVLARCREVARWTVLDVGTPVEQDEELSFDTMAPRRNGATLTALAAADTVLVVGTGDPIGLQRLVRACDLLGPLTAATREVVVTRVRAGPVGPDPERRIRETLRRFAGVSRVHLVPEDPEALDAASLHGQALVEVRPASAARAALQELAALLHGPDPVNRRARPRRGLLRRRRNG